MLWAGFLLACSSGAVARYLIDGWIGRRWPGPFPWGIFAVTVVGCFVLGVLTGSAARGGAGDGLLTIAGTGFCGAFTTFSTYTLQAVRLAEEGRGRTAAIYVFGSLLAGLAAAAAGQVLGGV